jgi:K+/H+ antiporter YhaU regulatory subunit KhtT
VTLLAVNRGGQILSNPSAEVRFVAGDVLFVVGHPEKIKEIVEKWR